MADIEKIGTYLQHAIAGKVRLDSEVSGLLDSKPQIQLGNGLSMVNPSLEFKSYDMNYAEGVRDVLRALQDSNSISDRLQVVLPELAHSLSGEALREDAEEGRDYYDKGVTTTPRVLGIDPTPHWWREHHTGGKD